MQEELSTENLLVITMVIFPILYLGLMSWLVRADAREAEKSLLERDISDLTSEEDSIDNGN